MLVLFCNACVSNSVPDPECLSRIQDPGSDFFRSRILDPGSEFFHPGSRIRIKEFKYFSIFNPKNGF
jgi:hypothetical protein